MKIKPRQSQKSKVSGDRDLLHDNDYNHVKKKKKHFEEVLSHTVASKELISVNIFLNYDHH